MLLLKNIIETEKKALLFLLKLLILLCLLKCIFFFYNYSIADGWSVSGVINAFRIVHWSLTYDLVIIILINFPLLLIILIAGRLLKNNLLKTVTSITFGFLNALMLFLNTVDIFYFRFHFQRADADMLYVLRNPFAGATFFALLLTLAALVFFVLIWRTCYKNINAIINSRIGTYPYLFTDILLLFFAGIFFLSGNKKLLPSYPLTQLEAIQLPLAQNSFHSFIYSIYRRNDAFIPDNSYMPQAQQNQLFSIHKKTAALSAPKNIVLFIMESVPLDFFDSSSPYKVTMPFLDSIVSHSTYFSNAFSYSYSSNKGITAILAGIPTITDIPLYHSNFTSINRVSVGKILAEKNYHSSFFIGDNYDDFGFAKCCKWLGIQQYYCMEDIPGYKQMEKHSLGLHDEYVLNFMQQKLDNTKPPFFAVQYNISTHYPNDIPKSFLNKYVANNTAQMKSMQYYNDCLQTFFKQAAAKPWFKNTVFIFCSDHWAQPHNNNIKIDELESFRIPLFIYDPANEKKTVISSPVSQLDIINTVMYFGGIKDSVISYGENLKDSLQPIDRTVFTKMNSAVYQAINSKYILGFNAVEGKPMYCFNYKSDPGKKNNLLFKAPNAAIDSLVLQVKAFLQTASNHYRMK